MIGARVGPDRVGARDSQTRRGISVVGGCGGALGVGAGSAVAEGLFLVRCLCYRKPCVQPSTDLKQPPKAATFEDCLKALPTTSLITAVESVTTPAASDSLSDLLAAGVFLSRPGEPFWMRIHTIPPLLVRLSPVGLWSRHGKTSARAGPYGSAPRTEKPAHAGPPTTLDQDWVVLAG